MKIKEIAELAGVSVASVSRTINNKGKVSPEVQQRILKVINEHNYVPNATGRALRTSRTGLILVSVKDISNSFFNNIIAGIQSVAKKNGYEVMLIQMEEDSNWEDKCFSMLANKQFDGMISTAFHKSSEELAVLNKLYPFVMVCECPENTTLSCVHTDNMDASYQAVNHLISTGHENIAMITLPPSFPTSIARLCGFKKALNDANLFVSDRNIVYSGYQFEDGYESCRILMEKETPPTAIFCYSDALAIGAVRYLMEHNIQPGKDVDVIGFDDLPFSSLYIPSISSIRQPCFEMGRKAFELLLEKINNPETPAKEIILPSELVLRDSTRKPV